MTANDRYGCGQFIKGDQIDKFALYEIAKYCDEEVSDGRGGKEPRFTFNGYINNRGEAYEVLNSIASAFRGMLYYANGTVVATQDRPGSVVKRFSASNVIQEVDESGTVTGLRFLTKEQDAKLARQLPWSHGTIQTIDTGPSLSM